MSGTNETVTFNNLSPYEESLYKYPGGYGGFNYWGVYELGDKLLNELNYCDTGYNNVLHGAGEGVLCPNSSAGGLYGYGGTAFTLKSGIFASAWETNQPVGFYAYAYVQGQGYVATGHINVKLSQTATTINFASYGKDFKNINTLIVQPGAGQAGNTCTYGAGHPTYGNAIAFDNLKVHWAGSIPGGGHGPHGSGHQAALSLLFHHGHSGHWHNPFAAHFAAESGSAHHAADGAVHAGAHAPGGYHSMLAALEHGHTLSLTEQFALPQVQHFGT